MTTAYRLDPQSLRPGWREILEARHHDPFNVLGRHDGSIVLHLPHAEAVRVEGTLSVPRLEGTDLFVAPLEDVNLPPHYRVQWTDEFGQQHEDYDPYSFAPQLSDYDLHLFGEGKHWHAYRFLGAWPHEVDGIHGVLFATWAPNAERVSVVGVHNRWDGRTHPMRSRGGGGVWELFIPGLHVGAMYKFEIRDRRGHIQAKSDPYGRRFEMRPGTAALVEPRSGYVWEDQSWLEARANHDWQHSPMSVYEVHLGSWQRDDNGAFLSYRELAGRLVAYVLEMGFTHIELLPITEHPLDASWGYQSTGYFAATSRYGQPDDLRYLVDHCHRNGIGVLVDWVPAHFPKDAWGLALFDGSALYEHEDPRRGEHRDWGTLIFNYGRNEVKNFLLASAVYWVEEFHIDGLRVDAVASMLYLDYSREQGDWTPNQYGGRENLEAIDFLRELNGVIQGGYKGTLMIAEESTAWPQVTRPAWVGGLGFSMKWNMGWMNDTLSYFEKDPVFRHYHHDQLTFGLMYAFSENFMVPLSHDEVVHGKGSMLGKMPGDEWQRFANLRLLYTYMFTYPGKKLLFMGDELAQGEEWNEAGSIRWDLLQYDYHRGMQTLVRDLNHLYRENPALHRNEFGYEGFSWIDCHDASQSVLSYRRIADGRELVVLLNFTPVPRENYRVGMPKAGTYREVLNSDSSFYGGSNLGNGDNLNTDSLEWMGLPCSLALTLPPLGALVLQLVE